jgi:hypothetical protein
MQQRRRPRPHSFEDQLATEKARLRLQLASAPRGPERDMLITKLRQIETASHINEWLSSPGLQPPRR